jgi:hypothetical protein
MNHVVDDEGWIFMGRGPAGFDTSTLIDGDIYQDGAGSHQFQHVAGDQFGRLCTGNKHAANNKVRIFHHLADGVFVRHHGMNILRHHVVEVAQPVDVHIDDRNIRAHAGSDLRGIRSDDTTAQYQYFCGRNTGNSTEEDPTSLKRFFKVFCALLD